MPSDSSSAVSPHRFAVVVDDRATQLAHQAGENAWWLYAYEALDHLRLPYQRVGAIEADALASYDTVLLASPQQLSPATVAALDDWVNAGGTVITTTYCAELADLSGAQSAGTRDDDPITFADHEAWTAPPTRSLRGIAGVALDLGHGVTSLAEWSDGSTAISYRSRGAGSVIIFGVDLWQTIVSIQQGTFVAADGKPAADGTAPIDDDLLKCEDGMTLDFEGDRAMPPGEPPLPSDFTHTYPPPAATPIFDQPQADQWWIALAQLIWWVHDQHRRPSTWLHYWPAGVPAIAHMSHDADQNVDEDARAALEAFAEAEVSVTWCQVFPGGYSPETYAAVTAAGHEQALHYNAMGDADLARWGWPQFRAQFAWAQAITGTDDIVSNKNHYTRWEGWTEFYTWCERVGIKIDESRGPSKQGSVGFLFGTAHLSFPMGDVGVANRPMDVINLPLHTQDLAWAGHIAVRDVILDGASQVHGVAHFLFHGPHLNKRPLTRAACPEVARLARDRGMEWWTARQISDWERARRGVDLSIIETPSGWTVNVTSAEAIDRAGLVLQLPDLDQLPTCSTPGGTITEVVRHGRTFYELSISLPAGESNWQIHP